MLPEIGHVCLLITMLLACINITLPFGASLPFFSNKFNEAQTNAIYKATQRIALGQWLFVSIAMLMLALSFVRNDFSVAYVATNSNILLPFQYKISAIWGGHEGSLLLWLWILCLWMSLLALNRQSLPLKVSAYTLGVLSFLVIGFLAFILFTSNPFDRILPDFPLDGQDLNPLLQDFGLIIHPPMLYMGYVGFSVPFAFAISGLIYGEFDRQWAAWSRPWAKSAWAFLGIGIALGSWWAYYELGWGGWWFWDPVENASLMPWLAGVALIHSLLACEKRNGFRIWTVLIAIITFSLSLLGTFLVRSGVLTSVHAFANDPSRGLFILVFLGVVVGGSLLLFSIRAERLRTQINFGLASKEFFLMLNNIFLLVACATVLLGTLFPIISDVLNLGKISVGPPYFNTLFFPLIVLILICLAVVPLLKWRESDFKVVINKSLVSLGVSSVLAIFYLAIFYPFWDWRVCLVLALCLWAFSLLLLSLNIFQFKNLLTTWNKLSSSQKNMHFGHLGLIITVVGISITSIYSEERDVSLAVDESIKIENYLFTFKGVKTVPGPNYQATEGLITVKTENGKLIELKPEKRKYFMQDKPMTEAAIDPTLYRDLYVALGEDLGADKWSLRIYHKPYIRLIWLGALIMGLSTFYYACFGSLFGLRDKGKA
jgi:cytochrome c-type biogenesis protein CcmF